jgi:hypothetical protein
VGKGGGEEDGISLLNHTIHKSQYWSLTGMQHIKASLAMFKSKHTLAYCFSEKYYASTNLSYEAGN